MNKKLLVNALKYGLGIAVLAFTIHRNWHPPAGSAGPGLAEALRRPIQVGPLAIALGIYSLGALLTFYRWFLLVRAQRLPFTPLNALRLGLIGFFWNAFLPGGIGGDIVKAAYIAQEQSRRTIAIASVLLDRAVGLWGIFWMVALTGCVFWVLGNPTIAAQPGLQRLVLVNLAIVGVTLGMWGLLRVLPPWRAERFAGRLDRIPRLGGIASDFWRAIWIYRHQGAALGQALLLSLASQVCFVVAFYFAAHVFWDPADPAPIPSLADHFMVIPIGIAIQALFPAPGGVGGGEASFGWLYTLVGSTEPSGVLACLANRVVMWSLGCIGILAYLRMRAALRPAEEAALELQAVEAS